jgi:preprotein translocase subunit SecD
MNPSARRGRRSLVALVVVFALAVGITVAVVEVVNLLRPKPAFPSNWYTVAYTVSPHPTDAQLSDAGLFLLAYAAHFGGTSARVVTDGDTVELGVLWDELAAISNAEGHLRPTVVLRSVVNELAVEPRDVGQDCAKPGLQLPRDAACSLDNGTVYQLGLDFLDATAIRSATAETDGGTGWAVTVGFTDTGRTRFTEAMRQEVDRRLAFVVVPAGDLPPRFGQWAMATPPVADQRQVNAKLPGLDQAAAQRFAATLRLAAAGLHLDTRA